MEDDDVPGYLKSAIPQPIKDDYKAYTTGEQVLNAPEDVYKW